MPWMRPEALAKTHLARYASPRGAPRSARQKNKAIQNLRSPQWLTFACVLRTLKRGYYIRGKSEKKKERKKKDGEVITKKIRKVNSRRERRK